MADEDYNDPRLSDVDDMDRDYDRRGSGRGEEENSATLDGRLACVIVAKRWKA